MFRSNACWAKGVLPCVRAHRARRQLSWFVLAVSLLGALGGCGSQTTEPDVDGQSHWWKLCAEQADCEEGFQCAHGACTKACTRVDVCGTTEGVRCSSRVDVDDDEFVDPEARVCVVSCTQSSDCPGALTCHAGVCVNPSVTGDDGEPTSEETSALVLDGGAIPSCEPPTECPPPPPDWCGFHGETALPPDLVEYWSSFCDAGMDAGEGSVANCGDGILQGDEACDDGNTVSGDGCSATCDGVEPNFDCNAPGQPCAPP